MNQQNDNLTKLDVKLIFNEILIHLYGIIKLRNYLLPLSEGKKQRPEDNVILIWWKREEHISDSYTSKWIVIFGVISFISRILQYLHSVFPGTPVSSINKADRHDVTDILFKVALNTHTLTLHSNVLPCLYA